MRPTARYPSPPPGRGRRTPCYRFGPSRARRSSAAAALRHPSRTGGNRIARGGKPSPRSAHSARRLLLAPGVSFATVPGGRLRSDRRGEGRRAAADASRAQRKFRCQLPTRGEDAMVGEIPREHRLTLDDLRAMNAAMEEGAVARLTAREPPRPLPRGHARAPRCAGRRSRRPRPPRSEAPASRREGRTSSRRARRAATRPRAGAAQSGRGLVGHLLARGEGERS